VVVVWQIFEIGQFGYKIARVRILYFTDCRSRASDWRNPIVIEDDDQPVEIRDRPEPIEID
jgi:hypothetical protein